MKRIFLANMLATHQVDEWAAANRVRIIRAVPKSKDEPFGMVVCYIGGAA